MRSGLSARPRFNRNFKATLKLYEAVRVSAPDRAVETRTMNRDHLAGGLRHLTGRAQTAAGGVTGDLAQQARGVVNQVAGGARYAYGDARATYRDLRSAASDAYDGAATAVERGRDLAGEAARRGRSLRNSASRAAGGDRTLGLLIAAGVGFALASVVGRR